MKPAVLVFGGHDPTGGAGIQADIEAIGALGGHALTIPTAITLQDSRQVSGFEPLSPALLQQQAKLVLADFPVKAIKVGMVATAATAEMIGRLLQQHASVPVILDPVLAGGGGGSLANEDLVTAIRNHLLPHTTLVTPNRGELKRLQPQGGSLQSRALTLLEMGCNHLLITGSDDPLPEEPGDRVTHRLYSSNGTAVGFENSRLEHHYHGSGCTLAAACATLIAHDTPLTDAVQQALDYTDNTLTYATAPASGPHFPNRLYRCQ